MNVNDKVSLEYEARVMVDENQYLKIKDDFAKTGHICREFTNKNTYFDTEDLYLTNHHMVLRIREIDDKEKELTLKTKMDFADQELTVPVSDVAPLDNNEIKNALSKVDVDINKLQVVAVLVTERMEVEFENYLLVIDKNYYNDKVDYNIEVESSSRANAENYLKKIIEPYNIEYKKDYISKSRRAILKL